VTVLHTVAGAAAVKIDFVVTPFLTEGGALREISRHGTTQLQCHRVFLWVKAQVPFHIAM